MGNHFGYTISGPQLNAGNLPIRLPKSSLMRRNINLSDDNLRSLYQIPATSPDHLTSRPSNENALHTSATPILPPTPPNVEDETDELCEEPASASDTVKARSILTTPVNQMSPPTPDNTPPREKSRLRPFLGTQPSMASTRAESFKTAHEDIPSDGESIPSIPASPTEPSHPLVLPPALPNGVYKPSPLAKIPITNWDISSEDSSPIAPVSSRLVLENRVEGSAPEDRVSVVTIPVAESVPIEPAVLPSVRSLLPTDESIESHYTVRSRKEGSRRADSLRKRLEDSQQIPHTSSVDKFANIIGWNDKVQSLERNHRRWSGTSNASTIEAFLIEPPNPPKKRNTLRHVSKNESLRSASSPLPNSNRNSTQSSSDSPHRLVHKKAKLSNQNRLSFGSEVSRPVSIGSSPLPKPEIIKVAVIPERSSSLQRSAESSRRHSLSTIGAPTSFHMRNVSDGPRRKTVTTDAPDRGRGRYYPPQVPTRGSSLSAPTSRNTSRASSVTSERVQFERGRDGKTSLATLDQTESENVTTHPGSVPVEIGPGSVEVRPEPMRITIRAPTFPMPIESHPEVVTPGSGEWAELRPTSTLHTPFSQPSLMSASPEISEARMISLHLHNNHSVQLIEPFPLQESQAVGEARKLNQTSYLESPLRNPRRPPTAPQVRFVAPPPHSDIATRLEHDKQTTTNPSTPTRPPNRPARTDSFKTLLRNVSLKHARNKKADQDLDSTLNPFWRPRPFWEGIEGASPEKKRDAENRERGVVNNSLGLPQQRLVVPGPLELVRKLSERRRNRRVIAKRPSHSSLQRLRTGRKIYRLPGFGLHFHVTSLKEVQGRIVAIRQKREEQRREKRREALRKSIGPNIIATGDSRFLSSMYEESSHR